MVHYGGENEVRIPDVEVLVSAASSDVALVSIYIGKTPHDEVEVVAAVSDYTEVGAIRAVLQVALQALNKQGWLALDELDTRPNETKTEPPFEVKEGSSSTGSQ